MREASRFREVSVSLILWCAMIAITLVYLGGIVIFAIICAVALPALWAYTVVLRAIDGARRVPRVG
ncbi:MAG: hypothetical protein A3A33_01195 [Candidatus Yanofskybacteria bacterium RIFCSPLOWO2_01_FULL_49_25]|uniref:Uncharacterized protein n=1 Tax=Candidatus Yanofskybacteria bacterium RIFCSPLOWO2_01_FULL_49_25 TaxID=1802701 RepID=A0A1F8GX99_9BACT|nr:MAG: hypothetical protein A3A33_01195 [Candidatus Yanofskybacteria bacterium RIFCSPLOWO2_01_FULL_49_25]